MKELKIEDLKKVLELHKKWLKGEKEGVKADLSYADLRGVDLSYTNLSYADLSGANLRDVNLKYADLSKADLRSANLRYTNLSYADLSEADLRNSNLNYSNLSKANLRYSNLSSANLRGANLSEADLNGANLNAIEYNFLSIGLNLVCPEEGSYIGYKKAKTKDKKEVIIKLLITEDALRSSATTRKCRCSKAKVLSITSLDEIKSYNEAYSNRDNRFIYKVGEIVEVKDFNTNRWKECSTGIHHFITRKEAVEY